MWKLQCFPDLRAHDMGSKSETDASGSLVGPSGPSGQSARSRRSAVSTIFVSVLLLSWIPAGLPTGGAASLPREEISALNVVIIFPFETGLPAYDALYSTVKRVIKDNIAKPVNIYAEYLDRVRFPDDAHQKQLFELYRSKYAERRIDLWLGIGYGAVQLVERYGKEVFRDSPSIIVDYAASLDEASQFKGLPRSTGVFVDLDPKRNLERVFSLQPDVGKVYVVSGAASTDLFLERVARTALQEYERSGKVVFLSGLAIEELLVEMERLPQDSAVQYLTFMKDRNGHDFYATDVARMISQKARVPVYCLVSTQIGEGVIGGSVFNIEQVAEKTGEFAVRILRGEPIDSIHPFSDGFVSEMFDWRQLKRHGIRESALPEGSFILYKEWGFLERYRWGVVGLVLFFLCQTILLSFLLHANRKQARTQERLAMAEKRYRELLHLDRLSRLSQLTAALAHELNQPLAAILTTAQAGLRFLSSREEDPDLLRQILESIVKDDKRAAGVLTNLRSMLKREEKSQEAVDMNGILEDVASILQNEAMLRKVTIERDLEESLPFIEGTPTTIRQVVLNLMMNALDAMLLNPPHRRKVVLETRWLNGTVRVAVKDFGPGIPAENPDQLFQPFHTTKGSGMGMGLAISREIVKEHGGRIWAENNPEGGASFIFAIPVRQDDPEGRMRFYY